MRERCNAKVGKNAQCRATQDLARVWLTVFITQGYEKSIPAEVLVHLCQKHLKLSPLQWLVATSKRTKHQAEATS